MEKFTIPIENVAPREKWVIGLQNFYLKDVTLQEGCQPLSHHQTVFRTSRT
jgi:hypothetical protein